MTTARTAPVTGSPARPRTNAAPGVEPSAAGPVGRVDQPDEVEEVGLESFPASDPPSWWAGED